MLKFYKEIVYFTLKIVGDKELAKDITQETYTRVNELLTKNMLKKDNIRAFLYKIAKNIALDEKRKDKRIVQIEYQEEDFFIPKIEQPDEILLKNDQYEQLIKIIDTLPNRSKEAFILHSIDGYSRKEIANIMGITVSAVEKHINRAIKKLQEKIYKNRNNFER
ncbi:RNA polymerase subunit sigma [Malaciobacter molluscorum]|uniref:RNA polymerase sigma factor n=1 Tax=Malaciobacter molluscorum TaxID=1032072 RepID=UPI00100B3806|nr:RNA polymerase sigma factor [Malaciobacter molluscorum]RXJ97473.1 RNA polymerase subunit sigma [Malaciobacter molluscorum]